MANGDTPDHREIWEAVNAARMELAELKGMVSMHLQDLSAHHHPPCKYAAETNRSILSAVGAAILALMAAVGALVMELIRK